MLINTNISAMNANRNLNNTNNALQKSLEKLSSGFRINRAADDAAGLAISETMRAQIGGLNQAQRNAQDGISLIQTAEGGLSEIQSMLQRMRELTVQASNSTYSASDIANMQKEMDQLSGEIDHISTTKFNGVTLLNGGGNAITIQTGANSADQLFLQTSNIQASTASLLVGTGTFIALSVGANSTVLSNIDLALASVSGSRAYLGANQNRLEHTINNLTTTSENLTAAEARIRDVDMAKEMSEFTKNQILSQAGTAMLAQANQQPQSILKLLG
ncbi:MAG: flagellin N-terminal helical domain-containing protein [Desulfitobacteriaceae bacterium]